MRFFLTSITFSSIRRAVFSAAALVTLSTAPRTFAQASPQVKRTVLLRHDAPAPGFYDGRKSQPRKARQLSVCPFQCLGSIVIAIMGISAPR